MDCAGFVGGTADIFFLVLYDIINDMKHLLTISITPQHNHFCCWLIRIVWPYLDVWAENGAYGICGLGWRYMVANLSCS